MTTRGPDDLEPPSLGDAEAEAAPQAAPGEERGSAAEMDLERARHLRRLSRYLQAGGIAFLAVVSLGLLPAILSAAYPAAGARAAIAVWVLVPAIPIGLLIVAAFRLPR